MISQAVVEFICLYTLANLNLLKEIKIPFTLAWIQFTIIGIQIMLNQPILIIDQILIYFAILLTSPILYIAPPTLVIVIELSKKRLLTLKDIRNIVDSNSSTNNTFQLIRNKWLLKDNKYTALGRCIRSIIVWLRND
jgi:hypothetical protein